MSSRVSRTMRLGLVALSVLSALSQDFTFAAAPIHSIKEPTSAPATEAEPEQGVKGPEGISKEPRTAGPVLYCCAIVANVNLKGRLGRLVIAFPSAAVPTGTRIAVFKDGREVQADYGNHEFELLSGTYEIKIGGRTVPNVTVKAGHDTKVRVGVLRITGANNRRAAVLEDGKEIAGAYGGELIGLPAGTFEVQMAGQTKKVTINEGKVTDF
ncbi:MAG TPA: hypothetical protein VFM24_07590 [Nitrospira sp.]|nr:hypothetical protein [Nitrospira sp.]